MSKRFILIAGFFLASDAFSAQWGPTFPTHRFPTDKSFHLNTYFSYGSQNAIYNDTGEKISADSTSQNRLRFTLNPEYQPTREFAIGAFLNMDYLKYSAPAGELTKSGIADQFVYGEYRFMDEIGQSIGFASIFKIPAYSNVESVTPSSEPFLLLGDGQIDATLLLTTEFWPWRNIKVFGDIGVTYRTDDFASEAPFFFGFDYVTHKYLLGLNFQGNLSFNNDQATQDAISQNIQVLTGNTNYVFAKNPQVLILQLKGEYHFNHLWSGVASFSNSLWGRNSPAFFNINAGISYHYYTPDTAKRSYKEVGIDTDDSSGLFEGELQEGRRDTRMIDEEF